MVEKTVAIKTFGCQMNVYDSKQMLSLLQEQGFKETEDLRSAQVILLNTCSIRDKAEHKVLSLLGELKGLKQKTPNRVIGVTGCVGQRMGRTLLQRVPHLDLVMGPDTIQQVGTFVSSILTEGKRILASELDKEKTRSYSQPAIVQAGKPCEFLTIMKGCDHFCTYCIVPFVRGREKSRSIEEIVNDVQRLAAHGTKEVTFLGQNINTYGKGTPEKLSQLIEAADKVSGIERIRYVTSHPRDLGQDLIEQFGKIEKLCPSLHLPFQSGSNQILKRMSRLYTREQYFEKIDALRKACPSIAMSADLIVGFPGETDQDFEDTLDLVKRVRFSSLFMFKYSPRPGTKAYEYSGEEIPEEIKDVRLARVQRAVYDIIEEENAKKIGGKELCLIEGIDKKNRFYYGRNVENKIVHVLNVGPAAFGKTIEVEITESNSSNLKGFATGAPKIIRENPHAA